MTIIQYFIMYTNNPDEGDFSAFKKTEKYFKKLKDFSKCPKLIQFNESEEELLS